jgi:predicted nuclease with RNAse H fold
VPIALGIDVGVRKGHDAVLLDDRRCVVEVVRHGTLDHLRELIRRTAPEVVAIDSPPWWARVGRSRATERALRRAGIVCFATPTREIGEANRFYDWMQAGFEVFGMTGECGYPRYRQGSVARTSIEVFPHATAVTLTGRLGPPGRARRPWRRDLLHRYGIPAEGLRGPDQVDAALAGLTGLIALAGRYCSPGDPDEGVIVLPVLSMTEPGYVREGT